MTGLKRVVLYCLVEIGSARHCATVRSASSGSQNSAELLAARGWRRAKACAAWRAKACAAWRMRRAYAAARASAAAAGMADSYPLAFFGRNPSKNGAFLPKNARRRASERACARRRARALTPRATVCAVRRDELAAWESAGRSIQRAAHFGSCERTTPTQRRA